jgi:hypothetical protein
VANFYFKTRWCRPSHNPLLLAMRKISSMKRMFLLVMHGEEASHLQHRVRTTWTIKLGEDLLGDWKYRSHQKSNSISYLSSIKRNQGIPKIPPLLRKKEWEQLQLRFKKRFFAIKENKSSKNLKQLKDKTMWLTRLVEMQDLIVWVIRGLIRHLKGLLESEELLISHQNIEMAILLFLR